MERHYTSWASLSLEKAFSGYTGQIRNFEVFCLHSSFFHMTDDDYATLAVHILRSGKGAQFLAEFGRKLHQKGKAAAAEHVCKFYENAYTWRCDTRPSLLLFRNRVGEIVAHFFQQLFRLLHLRHS